jgi:hypothetical protein
MFSSSTENKYVIFICQVLNILMLNINTDYIPFWTKGDKGDDPIIYVGYVPLICILILNSQLINTDRQTMSGHF